MRQKLVQIHLYAGLICSSTLMLLGINSIMRNHPIPSIRETKSIVRWEQQIDADIVYSDTMAEQHKQLQAAWATIKQKRQEGVPEEDLKPYKDIAGRLMPIVYHQTALEIRDELGLIGWTPRWEVKRQDNGDMDFNVVRPGKRQLLSVDAETGSVEVKEERKSVWLVIRAMHGLMHIPNSTVISVWGWYTEISIWAFIVMAVTSVFIWTYRRKNRRVGVLMLVGGFVISMSMILYIWLVG